MCFCVMSGAHTHTHTHNNDARKEFNVDDKYVTTPDALATASFHILCQKIVFLVKFQIYWNDSASFVDFVKDFFYEFAFFKQNV